jgi:protein TonB
MSEINDELNKRSGYESLDDIVFKTRNKEYGAYSLRKGYKKYAMRAFLIAFLIVGSTVAYPLIQAYYNRMKHNKNMEKNVQATLADLNQDAPPPPPPPPPPAAIEAQVRFKAPVVVDTVKEEVTFATVDDLKENMNEAAPEEVITEEAKVVVEAEEPAFLVVEENATFMGGDINSFRAWVQTNTIYPTAAAEAGIQGKVVIQFAVNSKGQLVDIKILRGVHEELDQEAIRVIKSSPGWIPGKQGGRAVKQQFVVPIVFQLQ